MTTMNHEAIYLAYPNVVTVRGEQAFDAQDAEIEIDQAKVDAAAIIVAQEQALASAQHNRASAFIAESDPLFFKAQRGEATMEEWQAKVAEIRARYPYPEAQ